MDSASAHASSQYPVTSVVNIQNHNMTCRQTRSDIAVWDLSLVAESEGWDRAPDEEISTYIASMSFEPGVESAWVIAFADACKGHGYGTHEASSFTDGIGAGT